jgi:hypothetical protein
MAGHVEDAVCWTEQGRPSDVQVSGALVALGGVMDSTFLREHAARCRSLAEKADQFTKRRLLDLAAKYESMLVSGPSRASGIVKAPVKFAMAE